MFKQVRLHDAILKFYQRSQPIAFSNAETLYDDLVLLRDQILMYGDLSEAQTNYLNEFIEKFDTTLTASVRDIFTKWLNDGFLIDLIRDIINEEVVVARDGEPSLNLRLIRDNQDTEAKIDLLIEKDDQFTAQLSDIVQINVKNFGAKGNNSTDDTLAINNAITAVNALTSTNKNPTLLFPSSEGYKTTGAIVIPDGISVIMESPIIYHGASDNVILTVGTNGIVNFHRKMKLNVIRNTPSNWVSENSIGIKLINCNNCDITIVRSQGSTIGVQPIGSGAGFVHNEVTLFTLLNNKIDLDLNNENSGWCNENNWYGGRFGNFIGVNDGLSRYGVRVTSKSSPVMPNDNNLFIKPSFEINQDSAGAGEAIPVLMEHGQINNFINCRSEGNSTVFARVLNNSLGNRYEIGYGTLKDTIDNQSDHPTDTLTSQRTGILNVDNPVFSSGAMHKKACMYNETAVNISGINYLSANNDNSQSFQYSTTIHPNYLEITNQVAVGIFVGTQKIKRFVLKKDVESGYGGKVIIKCYDANGIKLTNAGANHPYVQGASYASFAFLSDFGGAYQASEDDGDIYLSLKDEVAYIVIAIAGGIKPLRIRSFSIHGLDRGWASTWTGYEDIVQGGNLASQAPISGTWSKGKIVYNDNPTPGGYIGWLCTTGGSPGVWKGFGLIQA